MTTRTLCMLRNLGKFISNQLSIVPNVYIIYAPFTTNMVNQGAFEWGNWGLVKASHRQGSAGGSWVPPLCGPICKGNLPFLLRDMNRARWFGVLQSFQQYVASSSSHMIEKLFLSIWQDEDAFFTDYAASHKKLSELGFSPPSCGSMIAVKNSAVLAQSAVGVVVAVAVVIFSYFYEVQRRTKWSKWIKYWN